ncbi:MAG: hypothetical protein HZB54_02125 [Deltaproteobacteria bacterium]|nr:hypothetical protein [Deltaproteobacteria bacterium]
MRNKHHAQLQPLQTLDFKDKKDKLLHDEIVRVQKELIKKQGEIDQHANDKRSLTKLNREFDILKHELDDLLKTLFYLGNNDSLIPLIKEMYETN